MQHYLTLNHPAAAVGWARKKTPEARIYNLRSSLIGSAALLMRHINLWMLHWSGAKNVIQKMGWIQFFIWLWIGMPNNGVKNWILCTQNILAPVKLIR